MNSVQDCSKKIMATFFAWHLLLASSVAASPPHIVMMVYLGNNTFEVIQLLHLFICLRYNWSIALQCPQTPRSSTILAGTIQVTIPVQMALMCAHQTLMHLPGSARYKCMLNSCRSSTYLSLMSPTYIIPGGVFDSQITMYFASVLHPDQHSRSVITSIRISESNE